ncbi:MAG: molybdate ABC transporter substrate-binding protein [Oscillospiraceae bacterium]|nr:molybdate ABC transporter substrate-binding protein [Oscillospiraceae bacterium]
MKKILAILLALVMVFALAGCSSTDYTEQLDGIADSLESVQDTLETLIAAEEAVAEEEAAAEAAEAAESAYSGELIVFAAASMTETLTEIGDLFMEANPDVEIVFNFDSSGTLKTQIEEGADCDVFISAGQKQMDQLDITADESVNTDGLDFVISETRFDILENKVTLAVPEGNPAGIESFDQLAELLAAGDVFLAMGNEDVPVGQYTQLILEYYGLDEEELASNGCITYGSNVKEVTTQVSEATVDCGIIYATDAYSAGLTVVDSATAEMCGQVIYPAAVLNITSNQELAEAFLEFCTSDEASAILESVGFTPLA